MNKLILNIAFLTSLLFILISCSKEETNQPDFVSEGIYAGNYFPTNNWRECSPEEVGMNSKKLNDIYAYCANEKRNTYSFLIIKDGYIVAESYFNDHSQDSYIPSYSLAKSFTAALTGIAIQNGFIHSVNDSISEYFPQLQEAEKKM